MKRQDSKFAGSPFRSSDGAGCSSSSTTTIGFAAPSTPTDKVCTVVSLLLDVIVDTCYCGYMLSRQHIFAFEISFVLFRPTFVTISLDILSY